MPARVIGAAPGHDRACPSTGVQFSEALGWAKPPARSPPTTTATATSRSPTATTSMPRFEDTNCDGIDGDVAKAVFVDAAGGQDTGPGTRDQPKKTISAA